MATEETNFAETIFQKGRQTSLVLEAIGGVDHALVPKDCELVSLEKLMSAPIRIRAKPQFADVDGFKDYIAEFKQSGSRIFVDEKNLAFTTVFDAHAPGAPAWEEHSAHLALSYAHEWERFKKFDGQAMETKAFAEFLEDNLNYITGPISGADILTMAQNLKVDLKGDLQINDTLQAGLRHLVIKDESTLAGKVGDKDLAFPEHLNLALRIFKNHSTYPISVFVRYRCTKDSVKFMIKIPDPIKLQEEAFDAVIRDVAEKTGLPTLKGAYR